MDRLIGWLSERVPADDGRVSLVHGDWRIDNMIFDARSPRLLAVLDWELSTLGHPFADLAYQCMHWRLPNAATFAALAGSIALTHGIPTEAEYVAAYCRRAKLDRIPDWTFLIAFSFFRYRRHRPGGLQAFARRQRLEPAAGGGNARGRPTDGPLRHGGDRQGALRSPHGRCAPCGSGRAYAMRAADPTTRLSAARRRPRRGGRVVDRAALEMRSTCKRTGGSNPLPLRQYAPVWCAAFGARRRSPLIS